MTALPRFISRPFSRPVSPATSAAVDDIIRFVKPIVAQEELIADLLDRYDAAKLARDEATRNLEYAEVYLGIEEVIVRSLPPIVRQPYTRRGLRSAIRERVSIGNLPESLRFLFLPSVEQAIALSAFGLRPVALFILNHLGIGRLAELVRTATTGTVLEGLEVGVEGINARRVEEKAGEQPIVKILEALRKLSVSFYEEARVAFGEKSARELMTRAFAAIRDHYDYETTAFFLRTLPETLFRRERLLFLSREELERQAEFAVSERIRREIAEKTSEELRQTVENLNRMRAAMLNLLEDARRLEASLREERDRLSAILVSMGEGILVIDRRGTVVLMNPIAEKLLGISSSRAQGKPISDMLTVTQGEYPAAPVVDLAKRALNEGAVFAAQLSDNMFFRVGGGRMFPVSFTATPLRGDGITGAVIVFDDMTEQRQLEEARSGFISTASHQLRTPLTSMRWFSELMLDEQYGTLTERQRHFVSRINASVLRMVGLVNLLLQIARVEAGRVAIEPIPINLKELTLAVAQTLRASLDEKRQRLEIIADPDPPPNIALDQDMIWQVVLNLLSNANRYAPSDSTITVTIVLRGDMIEYSVRDRGIGIPRSQQGRIFEKFFRATNAIKLVPEGSGLGLTLVKSLVAEWEGKIWFESEEGKGTTFFVTIPLRGMKPRAGEVRLAV